MVSFDELRFARFDGIREHLEAWRKLVTQLGAAEVSYRNAVCRQTARAGWTGLTSGVADDALERVAGRIGISAAEAKSVHTALVPIADEFQRCQNLLNATLDLARLDGLTVTAQGTGFVITVGSSTPSSMMDPALANAQQQKMDRHRVRLEDALRQANEADARFASVLGTLMPGEVTGADYATSLQNVKEDLQRAAGLQGAGPIPPGMSPAQSAAWWGGLTPQQRDLYLSAYPHELGSKDGIPSTVRDQANRAALEARLAEIEPLMAQPNASVELSHERGNLLKIKETLETNSTRLPEQQLMLLKFDNKFRDGQVVMAIGNPDTAKNTVVHVPGTNTAVKDIDGQINRLSKLQKYSDQLTPGVPGDVAAVVWLDYDAPEAWYKKPFNLGFSSTVGSARSEEAAGRFDSFIDGMRSTAPPGQHLTASGHSYGSTVIADAARQGDGIKVDDILVQGSPGMHVDSADDLHLPKNHVWALDTGTDKIPWAGKLGHGGLDGNGPVLPSDERFGANRLEANPGGHSSYWDDHDGKPDRSLDNQRRVVMGMYDSPDPGNRPTLHDYGPDPKLA